MSAKLGTEAKLGREAKLGTEATGRNQVPAGAIKSHQEPSRVINSNQEHSAGLLFDWLGNQEQSRVIKSTPRACSLIGLAIKSNQEHSADLLLDWLEIEPRALRSAFVSAERDE